MVRKKAAAGPLLDSQVLRSRRHLPEKAHVSVDSTGWDARYASRYFLKRSGKRTQCHSHWIKSTFVCEHQTHLILAFVQGRGPGNDAAFFIPAIRQARQRHAFHSLSADAAYDVEAFHALCREQLGARRTAIPVNRRNQSLHYVPSTRYRREMTHNFPRKIYRQRNHAECVMSQCKRRIRPCLNARSSLLRNWEAQIKTLTFNALILADLKLQ